MAWGNITGEQKILPSTGGNSNEMRLEVGKQKVFSLLLRDGEEPYSYLEHAVEVEGIGADGKIERQFRTIRCPKTTKNPNAYCPLCDGQQLRRRVRNVSNAWDYEAGAVQKLNAGTDVWSPIATTRKLGVNILQLKWAAIRTGEGRNDTTYQCVNMGPADYVLPEGAVLFDIEAEYAPHSIEEMKQIVESIGGNWEAVTTLPALVFPTLEEALEHVMPNGKYKDQKFRDIWEADKSNRGMINFLATKSDRVSPEKAAAQVIMVSLGGANIPGVPVGGSAAIKPTTNAPTAITPPMQATPTQAPIATPAGTGGQAPVAMPNGTGRQAKVDEINALFQTKERFVKGGFQVIIDTMKNVSGGKMNIVDFTDAELDSMLVECKK